MPADYMVPIPPGVVGKKSVQQEQSAFARA
jgi:hypothetical protein